MFNFDLSFISEYFIPVVMVACLLAGFLIKHYAAKLSNQIIPLVVTLLGSVLTCVVNGGPTVENIVYGGVCGLASTGLHQLFKNFISGNKEVA